MREGPGGCLSNVLKCCTHDHDSKRRNEVCEVLYTRLLTMMNDPLSF